MHLLKKASIRMILSVLFMYLAACGTEDVDDQPDNQPTVTGTTPGSIAHFLANDSRFKVFTTALDICGKLSELDNINQKFTLFAPTDAAFNALPDSFMTTTNFVSTGDRSKLTINITTTELSNLLMAHVVTDDESLADISSVSAPLASENSNSTITVSLVDPTPASDIVSEINDSFPILNGRAQIIQHNHTVNSGRIHVIDAVLIPTTEEFPGTLFELLEATPLYRPYLQALRDAGANSVITALDTDDDTPESEYTVFIPAANLASAARIGDVAHLHLAPGRKNAADFGSEVENVWQARLSVTQNGTRIEDTKVVAADIEASNGVVHVMEGVIPFPATVPADVITTRGELTSFASRLNDNNLLDDLRTDSTQTIFAPTNAALAAFDDFAVDLDNDGAADGMLAELTKVNQLKNLLQYHMSDAGIANSLDSATLPTTINTMLGSLVVEASLIEPHRVLDGLIEVQETIQVGNSYVHIINNVLVPDDAAVMELTPPQKEFPGTTADALAYFSLFSEFAAAASNSPVSVKLDPADTGAFAGTLLDIFAFDPDDVSLLVPDAEKVYDGQFVDPYSLDTDGDETLDTNFNIDSTTVFAPVNAAMPQDTAQYIFDLDVANFGASDIAPYHAVETTILEADLTTGDLPSLTINQDGNTGKFDISVNVSTMPISLNTDHAEIQFSDLITNNGVIHVIDNVIHPSN